MQQSTQVFLMSLCFWSEVTLYMLHITVIRMFHAAAPNCLLILYLLPRKLNDNL